MFFRLRATASVSMADFLEEAMADFLGESLADFHLNNNGHSNNDDKETEELILIKGGRPAFFAIKRMNPELASPSAPQLSVKTASAELLRLLNSVTPELVTYNFMGHWADREQCRGRLKVINRAKDKLKSIMIHAENMCNLMMEVGNSLQDDLPILVVDKITESMHNILDEDFKKFQALSKTTEIVRQVFAYLCECCFVPIPADQLSVEDMSPTKYCDCHNHPQVCSSCGLNLSPCSLCTTFMVIFSTLRLLVFSEFKSVGKRCNLQRFFEMKSFEELFMSAQDSVWDCQCSDGSDDDEEEDGDQEVAENGEN